MADIFDKLVTGINKGVTNVGANSKAMIEKAKINTVIKNADDERQKIAGLLGMKVYEIVSTGAALQNADVEKFCEEISKRLQIIARQQEEIKRIDEETSQITGGGKLMDGLCKCGHVNAEGARFCAKCGSAL